MFEESITLAAVKLESLPAEKRLRVSPRSEAGWMCEATVRELVDVLQRWMKTNSLKPKG